MQSLSLPPPRNANSTGNNDNKKASKKAAEAKSQPSTSTAGTRKLPTYEERCRAATERTRMTPQQLKSTPKLFVPRSLQDFGDGGAYPEIHVAQYPRHMGNPHIKKQQAESGDAKKESNGGSTNERGLQVISRSLVNVEVDKDGKVSYDAIVKGGTNSDKIVYTRLDDMKGGVAKPEDIALPTADEEQAEAERAQAALQALVSKKTAIDKPKSSAMINADTSRNVEENTQFIKYTPRPDAPGYNPAASQRIIQMVPAQVDPMMPPKHRHIKAPPGPADDPVPVLHAPPKKLSKEEREAWNIPACISNWKNSRGYTIPLDKRLAADGRGLQENTISDNFATLSESLYVAEKQARQEVRLRAQVQKKLALQEKEKREQELRELANQARRERGGGAYEGDDAGRGNFAPSHDNESIDRAPIEPSDDEDDEGTDADALQQREKLRIERKREREKEMRVEKNVELKRKRLEEDRDVSEKVALGVQSMVSGQQAGGGDVDSRLYSQTAGMDTGFGAEDEYNAYSKPLFDRAGVSSASIYRPTRGETEYNADDQYDKLMQGAASKFQPDKGFAGAEKDGHTAAASRSGPVQFEKSSK